MVEISAEAYVELEARLGREVLSKRMRAQVEHAASFYYRSLSVQDFHPENVEFLNAFVAMCLLVSGMDRRGRRNSLAYRVEEREHVFPHLPPAFDGCRILHLTDIHPDGFADGGRTLTETLSGLDFDLCFLTGDYRFLTFGDYDTAMERMARIASLLSRKARCLGVLGNHDFIEFVPYLESAGVRMLLNESVRLERDGQGIWVAGVDDAHFYGAHDVGRAMRCVPPGDFSVFLSHTPEVYDEAARAGADLYLCGHTHGGQICLPGGIPVLVNAACPRSYTRGGWQHRGMSGYTSRGVGCSGVIARFNCPPEVTVHVLVRGEVAL